MADTGLAPRLYGYAEVEGAPTAYVMEYLDPCVWGTIDHMQLWALRSVHMRLLHFGFIHVAIAKCIICLRDYGLMFTKISDVMPSVYQSWETSKVKKTATKTLLRN